MSSTWFFESSGKNLRRQQHRQLLFMAGESYVSTSFCVRRSVSVHLGWSPETLKALVYNFGSEYHAVLKYAEKTPSLAETLGTSRVIKAEVVHAVREEMAQKLSDVVFRRTDLGTAEFPGDAALAGCAGVMAKELGWDNRRLQAELEQTRDAFACLSTDNDQKVVA